MAEVEVGWTGMKWKAVMCCFVGSLSPTCIPSTLQISMRVLIAHPLPSQPTTISSPNKQKSSFVPSHFHFCLIFFFFCRLHTTTQPLLLTHSSNSRVTQGPTEDQPHATMSNMQDWAWNVDVSFSRPPFLSYLYH
jgi:hypothetical protein